MVYKLFHFAIEVAQFLLKLNTLAGKKNPVQETLFNSTYGLEYMNGLVGVQRKPPSMEGGRVMIIF